MDTDSGRGPDPTPIELMVALRDLEADIDRRLGAMERRLDELAPTRPVPAPPPPRATDTPTEVGPTPPPPSPADATVAPGPTRRPERNVGRAATDVAETVSMELVFRWAGIGLVVLAAVFLVSTAVRRGWIGPELQLLGASLLGAGLLAGSAHLAPRRPAWSAALAHGGTVVLAVCAGAAHEWLALVGPVTGLVLVAATTTVSIALAVRQRLQSVAATAGGVALLVSTWMGLWTEAPPWVSALWLSGLAVVAAVLGAWCRWRAARLVITWSTAAVILGLAATGFDALSPIEVGAGLATVAVIGAVLWIAPAAERPSAAGDASATTGHGATGWSRLAATADLRSVASIPLWAWTTVVFVAELDRPVEAGGLGVTLAAAFAAVAVAAWAGGVIGRRLALSHLLGVIVLAAAALVVWFDGPALMAALAVQAAASLVVARRLGDRPLTVAAALTAAVASLLLADGLVVAAELDRIEPGPTAGHATVVVALAVMAWLAGGLGRPAGSWAAGPPVGPTVADPPPLTVAHLANGVAWAAGLGFVASLLGPVADERGWLVALTGLTLVSLAVVRRLGPAVLAEGVVLGAATTLLGAGRLVTAAAEGADALGHAANLVAVAGLAVVAAHGWSHHRATLGPPLLVAAWIGALGWVGSVLIALPEGHGAVSASWALAGAGAVVVGVRHGERVVRIVGLATLGVVLIKLLTVDLAEVDVLWRAGLFLVVGLGLLRLGYVLPQLAERYRRSPAPARPAAPVSSGRIRP